MRFSRHARNRLRRYDLSRAEVRMVLANPVETQEDDRGNPIVTGVVSGRTVAVIVAADDPGLVITLYDTRS